MKSAPKWFNRRKHSSWLMSEAYARMNGKTLAVMVHIDGRTIAEIQEKHGEVAIIARREWKHIETMAARLWCERTVRFQSEHLK
jgi:hypothetical protein